MVVGVGVGVGVAAVNVVVGGSGGWCCRGY